MAVTMFESGASAFGGAAAPGPALVPPQPSAFQLSFNVAANDRQQVQIGNPNPTRLAIKLKITGETAQYKSKPVFSFVEPGAATAIEVQRLPGGGTPPQSEMVVQYVGAGAADPDPKNLFVSGSQDYPSISVLLMIAGAPAPPPGAGGPVTMMGTMSAFDAAAMAPAPGMGASQAGAAPPAMGASQAGGAPAAGAGQAASRYQGSTAGTRSQAAGQSGGVASRYQ